MTKQFSLNIWVALFLIFLMVTAFHNRLVNFKNSPARTTDEAVYVSMTKQIIGQGLSGYNAISYGEILEKQGRVVYDYFRRPLYKHPPLFTFFLVAFVKLFGSNYMAAGFVSILMHVLTIPLVYMLGALLCDRRVGFCAALLYWMDPVSIICSQKIWPASTICFFSTLAIVCFVKAYKDRSGGFYILSGVASGLATVTKYTGFHATMLIYLYALIYDRTLFKNKFFCISFLLPFVVLMPWVYWNYAVYGSEVLAQQTVHNHILKVIGALSPIQTILFALVGIIAIAIFGVLLMRSSQAQVSNAEIAGGFPKILPVTMAALFIAGLWPQIINGFTVSFLPSVSWGPNTNPQVPLFYFGRLVEFNPAYLLAFAMFFISDNKKKLGLLRIGVFVILGFFIIWGNYQSRYIIAAIPFLLILASEALVKWYDYVEKIDGFWPRIILKLGLVFVVGFGVFRTTYVNYYLSFTNDMCYF